MTVANPFCRVNSAKANIKRRQLANRDRDRESLPSKIRKSDAAGDMLELKFPNFQHIPHYCSCTANDQLQTLYCLPISLSNKNGTGNVSAFSSCSCVFNKLTTEQCNSWAAAFPASANDWGIPSRPRSQHCNACWQCMAAQRYKHCPSPQTGMMLNGCSSSALQLYTVSQKRSVTVTLIAVPCARGLSNLNGFSKLFHWRILLQEVCNKVVIKDPTTP